MEENSLWYGNYFTSQNLKYITKELQKDYMGLLLLVMI